MARWPRLSAACWAALCACWTPAWVSELFDKFDNNHCQYWSTLCKGAVHVQPRPQDAAAPSVCLEEVCPECSPQTSWHPLSCSCRPLPWCGYDKLLTRLQGEASSEHAGQGYGFNTSLSDPALKCEMWANRAIGRKLILSAATGGGTCRHGSGLILNIFDDID